MLGVTGAIAGEMGTTAALGGGFALAVEARETENNCTGGGAGDT